MYRAKAQVDGTLAVPYNFVYHCPAFLRIVWWASTYWACAPDLLPEPRSVLPWVLDDWLKALHPYTGPHPEKNVDGYTITDIFQKCNVVDGRRLTRLHIRWARPNNHSILPADIQLANNMGPPISFKIKMWSSPHPCPDVTMGPRELDFFSGYEVDNLLGRK
ncbi:MAG: hypothetical protein EHM41_00975 [Chloroflexi bacterium]|nr:MAG: hypothetical protein EHM41_00975 [Chloroflexota bacterium]